MIRLFRWLVSARHHRGEIVHVPGVTRGHRRSGYQIRRALSRAARDAAVGLGLTLILGAPRSTYGQSSAPPVQDRDSARVDESLDLAARAASAYKEGRYEEAIDLYGRAHAAHPDPIMLHNVGRCHESIGLKLLGDIQPEHADAAILRSAAERFKKANASYADFLAAEPDASSRPAVEQRVRALEAQIKLLEDIAARPKDRPHPVPERGTLRTAAPWAIAGLGGATIGAGLVVGLVARGRERTANSPTTSGEETAAAADVAETYATTANVLLAVGGAIALGGAIWGIADIVTIPGPEAAKRTSASGPLHSASIRLGAGWVGFGGKFR